jgi:GNAT superfamily N-acetyltransferase
VDIREIDPADEALVHRHWAIGKAAEDASRPYDFYPPWESTWLASTQPRQDADTVVLGAFDDDVMWGAGRVYLSLLDNLHTASAEYHVHPERVRRGLGTALAEASYDVARRRGRRTMVIEAYAPVDATSPGLEFAAAMGFTPALEDGMKVVDLLATEHLWDALADKAAGRHTGYTLVTWSGRVPDQHVAAVCRLNEQFNDEAPMGELEVERERWDEERLRGREARNEAVGRVEVCAGAVAPDGELVGLTEVAVNRLAPTRGFQSGTLVDPAHRGRGLGVAMKVANHRRLRALFPELTVLMTGNAGVNAPMNAVNEALGYREVERCVELQRPI